MSEPARLVPLLEGDLAITIVPGPEKVPEHLIKFRWNMQIPLPYPFPSRKCVRKDVTVGEKPFSFQIHNHFDRVYYTLQSPESGAKWTRSFMHDKRKPLPELPQHCI